MEPETIPRTCAQNCALRQPDCIARARNAFRVVIKAKVEGQTFKTGNGVFGAYPHKTWATVYRPPADPTFVYSWSGNTCVQQDCASNDAQSGCNRSGRRNFDTAVPLVT